MRPADAACGVNGKGHSQPPANHNGVPAGCEGLGIFEQDSCYNPSANKDQKESTEKFREVYRHGFCFVQDNLRFILKKKQGFEFPS